jgi:biotin-dependent carboxylase-like uncharacterized protein
MATLHVIAPGMLTTVQDHGRWGWQARGVPVAGAMDPWSHRVANALVGNEATAATLESTLVGPAVEFDDERVVAVTGAECELTLDDRTVAMNTPFVAPAGSRLRCGRCLRGARSYLAVDGGIATPLTLGSRSTHLMTAMGGFEGRALKAGDRLLLGVGRRGRMPPHRPTPRLPSAFSAIVRVLPGPQRESFTPDALDILQSAPYAITGQSDRMGFRLDGPRLAHTRGADIISDATPLGAIQVPASGQPILLMADRQTTGGYPKIATVITADIGLVGQLAPADSVSFLVCSRHEAMAALVSRERALMELESRAAW